MKSAPDERPGNEVSREEALAVYKKFVDRGIESPDKLDLKDPEVKLANKLYETWVKQEAARVKKIKPAAARKAAEKGLNYLKTNFYFDAGFRALSYLPAVREWNALDEDDLEGEHPDIEKLRADTLARIQEINAILEKEKLI